MRKIWGLMAMTITSIVVSGCALTGQGDTPQEHKCPVGTYRTDLISRLGKPTDTVEVGSGSDKERKNPHAPTVIRYLEEERGYKVARYDVFLDYSYSSYSSVPGGPVWEHYVFYDYEDRVITCRMYKLF